MVIAIPFIPFTHNTVERFVFSFEVCLSLFQNLFLILTLKRLS